jgi:hypothetical protein
MEKLSSYHNGLTGVGSPYSCLTDPWDSPMRGMKVPDIRQNGPFEIPRFFLGLSRVRKV